MIILGVDPGSRLMGFGVVEKIGRDVRVIEHGTIRLFHKEYADIPVDETTPSRLKEIFEKLSEVIKRTKATVLAVEKVFFAKNAVSALKLGQARGVVLLTGAVYDLEIYEYSVTEIKSMITGHGRADKEQVSKMIQMMVGKQEFETPDASDALALALGHALALQPSGNTPKTSRKSGNSLKSLAEAAASKSSRATERKGRMNAQGFFDDLRNDDAELAKANSRRSNEKALKKTKQNPAFTLDRPTRPLKR